MSPGVFSMALTICYEALQLQEPRISEAEWALPTGNGGYACGTLCGIRNRRYHSLFTAADEAMSARWMMLAEVEAWVTVDDQSYPISNHAYRDVCHPDGHLWLSRVEISPVKIIHTWQLPGCTVTRTLRTSPQGVRLTWQVSGSKAKICLTPLFGVRDHHALTHAQQVTDAAKYVYPNTWWCKPFDNAPAMWWRYQEGVWCNRSDWYYRFLYITEKERGLDHEEDLWTPGHLVADVTPSQPVVMEFGINEPCSLELLPEELDWSDLYLFNSDKRGQSMLAGLPWFTDWGRDTMIAMPGLLFVRGQYAKALSILRTFAESMNHGLIPNRFPDQSTEPEYNTVDATLWFARRVEEYLQQTRDDENVSKYIWPALKQAMHCHLHGTLNGIMCDPTDGLLAAGNASTQLTWMDAKVCDVVITPRAGKPIEISGLWIQFMRFYLKLCADARYGSAEDQPLVQEMLRRAEASFDELYWMPRHGWYADVAIDGEHRDERLRPNQLIALSIPNPPAPKEHIAAAFEACTDYLLTPYGLRTLAPFENDFKPKYEGGIWERDSAYHQGTVWPWLLSVYVQVYIHIHATKTGFERQTYINKLTASLRNYAATIGGGHVAEVFDAQPPYLPGGCFAQAWSDAALAEILSSEPSAK